MDFNNFLESINQNIREALFRGSEDGLIYANGAYVKMFGFRDEIEAINTPSVLNYKNPQDRTALVKKLIKHGHCDNQEIRFVRRDKTEFVGLVSTTLFENEDGEIYWDGSIRDVTKQREIINQLLDREQLLDSINKNINEAIYRSINREGLIYVNDEFVKMFGYENAEELLHTDVSVLYKHPNERYRLGNEIIDKDSIENREVEFRRKDGTTFWGYLNSIKIKGQDGKIYFDGAIRDITDEKVSEAKFKKQAEMQELLIYISSNLINLSLDDVENSTKESLRLIGQFVEADRAYIFEFDADNTPSVMFTWIREGVKPIKFTGKHSNPEGQIKEHFQLFTEGKYLHIKDIDELEDGELKELYKKQNIKTLLSVPLMTDRGCIGYVGFDWVRDNHRVEGVEILLLRLFSDMFVNIKERTSRELELRKLFEKTIEQNQRLKDFSYITSHNFRSSVANLMGLITVIEEDRNNEEFFGMMKDTALKLNLAIDSINDLLNFEKDTKSLEKKECRIAEIVSDVLILNKKVAKEKNINFEVSIPECLTIKVLPAYLQSIILNLVTNAMKYGVTSEKRNIYIHAEKQREVVLLEVADEGLGIDLERFGGKLFQLGSRFHSNIDSGHGMGLYITKQQIEAIGGRVEVESEVSKGTKFKVYLNA